MNNNQARVDQIIAEIKLSMARPGWKPQTAAELRKQSEQRRHMASAIALIRGWEAVRPEYQPIEREPEDF